MRLIDCLIELITYTLYFLENLKTDQTPYGDVHNRYQQLMARADKKRRDSGFSDEEWESGLFAVCAWIDEIILCSDWSEKERWAQAMLQRIHFNTTSAGEEFFVRLDGLDMNARNVREVYAFCLALGFKGRYFLAENEGRLEEIKRTNLSFFIETVKPEIPDKLFPGAYSISTGTGKGKKWLRLISPATIPFIILPVIVFVALFFLYKYMLEKMILNYFGSGF